MRPPTSGPRKSTRRSRSTRSHQRPRHRDRHRIGAGDRAGRQPGIGAHRRPHADFNSKVKKGQIIAKIDPELFNAAVEQARANHAAAKGNLEKSQAQAIDAQRQFDRREGTGRKAAHRNGRSGHPPSPPPPPRGAQVAASQGAVEAAPAASLHQAQVNLEYSTIKSPIDGVVISRKRRRPGRPSPRRSRRRRCSPSPKIWPRCRSTPAWPRPTSASSRPTCRPPSSSTHTRRKSFAARFGRFPQRPDERAERRHYDAVIDVDNPDLKLKPGMTAKRHLHLRREERDAADPERGLEVPSAYRAYAPRANPHPHRGQRRARRIERGAGSPPGGGQRPNSREESDPAKRCGFSPGSIRRPFGSTSGSPTAR